MEKQIDVSKSILLSCKNNGNEFGMKYIGAHLQRGMFVFKWKNLIYKQSPKKLAEAGVSIFSNQNETSFQNFFSLTQTKKRYKACLCFNQ